MGGGSGGGGGISSGCSLVMYVEGGYLLVFVGWIPLSDQMTCSFVLSFFMNIFRNFIEPPDVFSF